MGRREFPGVSVLVLSLVLPCVAFAMAGPAQESQANTQASGGAGASQQKAKKNHKSAPEEESLYSADPSQYVGADTCKTCHQEAAAGYDKGPHWKTTLAKHVGPQWQGCEACHGPGKAHAESGDPEKIIRFGTLSREASSKRCLACHEYTEEHVNFLRSTHLKNNVGCVDCHTIHTPRMEVSLLKAAQPQLCYSCHLDVRPAFSLPYHHRVNEGLLTCTNCHNPHGGFLTHQLRSTAAQDLLCFNCHTDKAGPFAFEHGPVKTEGCVACHSPHGSSNPRLLRRSQINLLCLECHTLTVDSAAPAIPSFHNQAQKYQACTLCHVAIHGSNTDHFFFRP
jgi:DmsE family decaheme c-type cytochrome